MPFCSKCGNNVPDGATFCSKCGAQVGAAPQQQTSFQQPGYGYQPQADSKFVVSLKNIPAVLLTFWKDSADIIKRAKKDADVIGAGIFSVAFYVILVIFGCCFSAKNLSYSFDFGLILITSLIMAASIPALYVIAKLICVKPFNKTLLPSKCINDAFIEYGYSLVPVSVLVLLAGLLGFIHFYVCCFFLGLAFAYMLCTLIKEIYAAATDASNEFVLNIVTALVLAVVLFIFFWLLFKQFMWLSRLGDYLNYFGGYR